MNIIREELHRFAIQWNLRKMRPSRNEDSPCGRPAWFALPCSRAERGKRFNDTSVTGRFGNGRKDVLQ